MRRGSLSIASQILRLHALNKESVTFIHSFTHGYIVHKSSFSSLSLGSWGLCRGQLQCKPLPSVPTSALHCTANSQRTKYTHPTSLQCDGGQRARPGAVRLHCACRWGAPLSQHILRFLFLSFLFQSSSKSISTTASAVRFLFVPTTRSSSATSSACDTYGTYAAASSCFLAWLLMVVGRALAFALRS